MTAYLIVDMTFTENKLTELQNLGNTAEINALRSMASEMALRMWTSWNGLRFSLKVK